MGNHGDQDLCGASRVSHCIVISPDTGEAANLYAGGDRLPLASESVDVFVLPHTLEFHPNPHALLREVDRVLIPEGHVVILSFNPWSLWGVFRVLLGWRKQMPWCGQYYSRPRLRDWLSLLGFDYRCGRQIFFKPALQHDDNRPAEAVAFPNPPAMDAYTGATKLMVSEAVEDTAR